MKEPEWIRQCRRCRWMRRSGKRGEMWRCGRRRVNKHFPYVVTTRLQGRCRFEPARRERAIVQIVIRALGEPQVCLVAVQSARRRNQWCVTEQGTPWRKKRVGAWTIGGAVGRFLALRARKCHGA